MQRKIKHMGIHEASLQPKEMQEKLKLLNENFKYLYAPDNAGDETAAIEADTEAQDGEDDDKKPEQPGRNRKSVDIIRTLEDKLGLPISTKNARVLNYKDQLHVPKEEFVKSQENASQFIAKMKEHQKEVRKNLQTQREKTTQKVQAKIEKNMELQKQLEEEKKQKLQERIEQHKEMLEKEKEARSQREQNWKMYKHKEKTSKYLHEKIQDQYQKEILMPELEK